MKSRIVFWDVLPCKIIVDPRLKGSCWLHHNDGEWSTYLWNVGRQLFYTAVHPRRQTWTSYSPRRELEISLTVSTLTKPFSSLRCESRTHTPHYAFVLCASYIPMVTRKILAEGWRLWCCAGGMFATRWTRGLLLASNITNTTTYWLKTSNS
jgi:hypothetical protein